MKRHRFNRFWQRKSHKERSCFLLLLEKTLSTNFLGGFGGSVVLTEATRAGCGTVLILDTVAGGTDKQKTGKRCFLQRAVYDRGSKRIGKTYFASPHTVFRGALIGESSLFV